MTDPTPTPAPGSCGWVKLYHPRGPLVTLPVGAAGFDYAAALATVSAALDAGFLTEAPGLEAGESRFDCAAVVRRTKANDDGTETPVVDLYERDNEYKTLSVYLNTPEDIAAFEFAAGLRLADLKDFPGSAAPQRGQNRQTDAFFASAPRPFGVVWKPNPKHDPAEQDTRKKKPKRLFVRWADARPPAAGSPAADADAAALARWEQFAASDPPLDVFNRFMRETLPDLSQPAKERMWGEIKAHAKAAGWAWADGPKCFQPAGRPAMATA